MSLCEWNPASDKPSFSGSRDIGCQNAATLSVGGKATALHLCESCAALPRFKRRMKGPILPYVGEPTEAEIQAEIVKGLIEKRYIVHITSGKQTRGLKGITRGLADLLVTHENWPVAVWMVMEVKRPSGTLKPEQKVLHNKGRICVVRSWVDAHRSVMDFEGEMAR